MQAGTLTELRQVLAELSLVSQVGARELGAQRRDQGEDVGGRRPGGGVDRRDDRAPGNELKSADHFLRRLAGVERRDPTLEGSEKVLELILQDARASLAAHRRQPRWRPGQVEPERGTVGWRRMIADSSLPASTLARRYSISKRTVHRYRADYGREPEPKPARRPGGCEVCGGGVLPGQQTCAACAEVRRLRDAGLDPATASQAQVRRVLGH